MKITKQDKYEMVNLVKTELEEMFGDLFQPNMKIKLKILITLQNLEVSDE